MRPTICVAIVSLITVSGSLITADAHETSIDIAHGYDVVSLEASNLFIEGNRLYEDGRFLEAIKKLEEALQIFETSNDLEGKANVLNALGIVVGQLERYDEAVEYFSRGAAAAREAGNKSLLSYILLNLGSAYDYTQDFEQSLSLFEEAINVSQEVSDDFTIEIIWEIADLKRATGQPLDSIRYYEQLLEYSETFGNTVLQIDVLNQIGEVYRFTNQHERAIAYYQQAWSISEQTGVSRGVISNNLGLGYINLGRYTEAIRYLEISVDLSKSSNDLFGEATSLSNIGFAYFAMGDYPTALGIYQESLTIRREIDYQKGIGENLLNIGSLQNKLGKPVRAEESLNEALNIFRNFGDVRNAIEALFKIGEAQLLQGDYSKVVTHLEEALDLSQANGIEDTSRLLSFLGDAYIEMGQFDKAWESLENALAIAQSLNDAFSEANIYNSMGIFYRRRGEYPLALQRCQNSLDIAENIESLDLRATLFNNLGLLYGRLGQYSDAIEYLTTSLELRSELGLKFDEVESLNNIAILYFDIGRLTQASKHYEDSLILAREINYAEGENIALNGFANLNIRLGRYQEAIDILEKRVLPFAQSVNDLSGEASILVNLGDAYRELNDTQAALEIYNKALGIFQSYDSLADQGQVLRAVGLTYFIQEDYERASEYYQQALEISQTTASIGDSVESLASLAAIAMLQGELEHAKRLHYESVELLEQLRDGNLVDLDKVALLNQQFNVYEGLQKNLVLLENYESALEVSERVRARAFVELIQSRLIFEQGDEASQRFPEIADIQSLTQKEQSTLVEYSIIDANVGAPVLFIWVVSPLGEITFRQESLDSIDLTELVTSTRQTLGVRGSRGTGAPPQLRPEELARRQAEQDEKLSQLHHILIEPIADLLPDDPDQPVVFIPQGELFLVPFPALKDDNGDYLIENHTILTAPSIQVLQLTHDIAADRERTTTDKPVIVGNPTMPTVTFLSEAGNFEDVQLSSLFGAQQEAQAVAEFLDAPVLIGTDATEATVKQQIASADLIHLATHGLLEYGDPRETGTRDVPGAIALTPGNGEDGLLTSAEILQMDLQADLVVLSACDTGRGRITGDGVIGLSRSFIAAGVPSVVVSLWAVPDAPTADLMTEFYRQLDQGQTKAQALRQAMLITMQDHPDPKDWAAFTLIGESE